MGWGSGAALLGPLWLVCGRKDRPNLTPGWPLAGLVRMEARTAGRCWVEPEVLAQGEAGELGTAQLGVTGCLTPVSWQGHTLPWDS